MALKALDIFKLTPKKNCKDCGFPTCMAFCMKVASGAVEVEKCPHMSDEALAKLSEATAPLMRGVKVGNGTSEYELGSETVLFRHEKTLVNRNRYAVAFNDAMTNEDIDLKIANIKAVNYIRIGEEMKAEMVVLEYRDNKEGFINLVNRVNESTLDVTHIIVCEDVEVAKEAIAILKDKKPVVYGANKENYQGMVELVKDLKLALGVKAANLEELYATIEAIQGLGYRELILDVTGENIKDTFTNAVQVRRIALKEQDRTFGYPSIVFANKLSNNDPQMEVALSSMFTVKYGSIIVIDDIVKEQDRTFGYPSIVFANKLSNNDPQMEVALSSMFTVKYGSIIVIDDIDYSKALPLFALRQNIYTDPQRPMRVEPKVYPMNNADDNAPVMVTVDFALTYFIVSGDIERSKVPAYLAIPDAGGYSVLTAWSAGKFSGSSIANFIKESKIEEMTKNRDLIIPGKVAPDAGGYSVLTAWSAGKFSGSSIANFIKESKIEEMTKNRDLIIPGKVAVLKGDIEDALPGWNVIIGTEESMEIPKFLKEYKEQHDKSVANA